MSGVCRLMIRSATLEDSGEYTCKISKQPDKTETILTIIGRYYFYESQQFNYNFLFITLTKKSNLCEMIMILFLEYPYKFVKVLKHQQLIEKETLTLLCELDDAAGEVQWFKGDQAITPDKRYFLIERVILFFSLKLKS